MKKLVVCLGAAALLAGCARIPIEPYTGEPVVLPHSGENTDAFEQAVARRMADLKTFRGKGIIRIEAPRQRPRQFDYLIMAEENRGMRLRATRAVGPVLFELIADTERFAISIPPLRNFYVGDQRAEGGEQSAVLSPSGVVDPLHLRLIDGSTRRVEYTRSETTLLEYTESAEGGEPVLRQEIIFDPDSGLVRRLTTYDATGQRLQTVRFEGYKALEGLGPDNAFPMLVAVDRGQVNFKVELRFREVTPNPSVAVAAFDLTPPRGYRVKPASELDPNKMAQMEREAGLSR